MGTSVSCVQKRVREPHVIARVLSIAALCVFVAVRASAQTPADGEPDPSSVRVRIGPLLMNPTIALTNMGVDDNVFNEPTDQNPKRDFTFTLDPKTDLWLRVGRTWVTGLIDEQIVWYQKYSSERSTNNRYRVGWNVPLNRLSFKVNASYLDTRERPGFEIDARAQRDEKAVDGTIEIRALAKTYFGVRASRQYVDYAQSAIFADTSLHDELNRVVTIGAATVRQEVTPLTSVMFDISREQDRFTFDPLRDANTTMASAAVKFDRLALIKGTATVGYERFEPLDRTLPAFSGTTAAVDLSYVLLGVTKFGVQADRGVQYSFDVNQPYYLQTGVGGSIAQQLFGPVDVVARGRIEHLVYRDRAGAVLQSGGPDRSRRQLWRRPRVSHGERRSHRLQRRSRQAHFADFESRIQGVAVRNVDHLWVVTCAGQTKGGVDAPARAATLGSR